MNIKEIKLGDWLGHYYGKGQHGRINKVQAIDIKPGLITVSNCGSLVYIQFDKDTGQCYELAKPKPEFEDHSLYMPWHME